MRRMMLALLLVVGFGTVGAVPRSVYADRPTLVVGALGPPQYLEPRPHGLEGFTHQQAVLSLAESLLSRALELYFRGWLATKPAGWECLEVRASGSPSDRPDHVHVGYDFVPAQEADLQLGRINVWRVTIQVNIRGMKQPVKQTQSLRLPDYGVERYDDNLEDHAADQLLRDILHAADRAAGAALDELKQKKMEPCKAKARLKGTHKHQGANLFFERRYDGEADLALKEDGTFAATMTLPDAFVMTTSGPVQCRFSETGGTCQGDRFTCDGSFQPRPTELALAGGYRNGDGSLVFTRMEGASGSGTASARCCAETVGCWDTAWEIPSAAGNLIPVGELAVALADGASVAIPAPAGVPGEWAMSLTLTYGGEGAAAAGATSAAPLPRHAE